MNRMPPPKKTLGHMAHSYTLAPAPAPLSEDLPPAGKMRLATFHEQDSLPYGAPAADRWVVTSDGYLVPLVEMKAARHPAEWIMVQPCPYGCGRRHLHGAGEGHRLAHCAGSKVHPWRDLGYWIA